MNRFWPLFFLLFASFSVATFPARAQKLVGFARFPAQTFVSGPTSGQKIEVKDGLIALPFTNQQPIQGLSSLSKISATEFWALEDNGFGTKANSGDFLLRILRLKLDFKTRKGGLATAQLESSILLRDPQNRAGFLLTRDDRQLTGADFDPESLVVARDGTFWIGEEFGPFLLHFSLSGELLEAPFAVSGVASPDDPLMRIANIKASRGFEGLSQSPDKSQLFGLLEGALDGQDRKRLPLYTFDLKAAEKSFQAPVEPGVEPNGTTNGKTKGKTKNADFYPLETGLEGEKPHSIGEIACFKANQFLVIERDSFEGDAAVFKRVFAWNRRGGAKKLVADLLQIADPDGLAGARGEIYRMPFQTIESVVVLDKKHLLVCSDNNFPFGRGRGAATIEATEFAVIELPKPLF